MSILIAYNRCFLILGWRGMRKAFSKCEVSDYLMASRELEDGEMRWYSRICRWGAEGFSEVLVFASTVRSKIVYIQKGYLLPSSRVYGSGGMRTWKEPFVRG
jgi:hypothetical protein